MRVNNFEDIWAIVIFFNPDLLQHDLMMLGRMAKYLMHFGFILIDALERGGEGEAFEELAVENRRIVTAICAHLYFC